jgi:hypothetical protein
MNLLIILFNFIVYNIEIYKGKNNVYTKTIGNIYFIVSETKSH